MTDLALELGPLAWPAMTEPVPVKASAVVEGARVGVQGQATPQKADLAVQVDGLGLALARPYLADVLRAQPQGQVSTRAQVHWQAQPAQLNVNVEQATVSAFALGVAQPAGRPARARPAGAAAAPAGPGWRSLTVESTQIDVMARRAAVGSLVLDEPQIDVSRDARGRWMFEDWLVASPSSAPARAAKRPASAEPGWSWTLGRVAIKQGRVRYRDVVDGQPMALNVQQLDLALGGYAMDRREATPVSLSAALSSQRGPVGQLALQGQLGPVVGGVPQSLDATDVRARQLPLQILAPFIPALSQLDVHRADGSFTGKARYESTARGPRVSARGNILIEGVRADARPPTLADEAARQAWLREDHQLLSWRSLQIDGFTLAMAPGQRTRIDLAGSTLTDLFARLLVTPQGELSLEGLYGAPAEGAVPAAATSHAEQRGKVTVAEVQRPEGPGAQASTDRPLVNLGPTRMVNGRIAFTDQFVQPNYSANLSRLTGRLGASRRNRRTGSRRWPSWSCRAWPRKRPSC